ncbi:winged helix-turn-helix transcriptional regulator, partial [Acidithiobacillus sp.]|uniref:winged helix-turn-helix transcriptional regulator n=1 Tax=Acidithiobacillus sp. TaxID=1872118 RepID=UPI003D03E841
MLDDATRYHLLKLLTEHPESTQRELAAAMGVSLGLPFTHKYYPSSSSLRAKP